MVLRICRHICFEMWLKCVACAFAGHWTSGCSRRLPECEGTTGCDCGGVPAIGDASRKELAEVDASSMRVALSVFADTPTVQSDTSIVLQVEQDEEEAC